MKIWLRFILGLMIFTLTSAYAQTNQTSLPVEEVGDFSNMRFTEEHQYGYEVRLWKQGDNFFGLFSASAGLAGDTPTGLLEKISFVPSSGKLSFTARLTTGMTFVHDKETPSHDLFEFDGLLNGHSVSGNLKHQDMLFPALKPEIEKIKLQRQPTEATEPMPATYLEWRHELDPMLKRLGPRW